MQRWWRRVVLYWHAPENGWTFYTKLDCIVEIAFMTLWSVMGLYDEQR